MPSNRISKEIYDAIQKAAQENPAASNRDIARSLGVHDTTVMKYRNRPYGERFQQPTIIPPVVFEDGKYEISREELLRRENEELKKSLKEAINAAVLNQSLQRFVDSVVNRPIDIPQWTRKSSSGKKDAAIITAFLSDLHLDEVVRPEQIGFVNEYNRDIARKRLKNFFDNTIKLASEHLSGMTYEGITLALGGDIFSGNIHEELRNTNEATLIESLLYWPGLIVSGIKELAHHFGKVFIPGVVGNHGRLSMKPIAKNRAQDNFDYLLYHMLARELKDDKRVTFAISEGADFSYSIYETRFLLTHGDQFRGGSGIAGLLSPLLLGDHRKRKRQTAVNRPYDWMIYGHWHSLVLGVRGLIGNGSLKGYDEYAQISNFDYEPPQQAFFLTQPRVGVTGRFPIHVVDKSERFDASGDNSVANDFRSKRSA